MKDKKIIITLSIIIVLVITIGVTYSLFTFSKVGKNSNLIVGDIYMHYNETNELIIENAMPTDKYDESKYFEFTVDGKNTYDKPIYYEIDLTNGNEQTGKTRIDSNLLTFRLTEIINGVETEIFHNRAYSDLTNKRIHVDTISQADGNVNRTYRLYMKVGDYTRIGNTSDADYTMEEWNNIYASIKVKVIGDFSEKTIETDASNFSYSIVYNDKEYAKQINVTFTLNDISTDNNKVKKCTDYILNIGGINEDDESYSENYNVVEPLCRGEEVAGMTLNDFFKIASNQGMSINYNYLKDEGIISEYQEEIKYVANDKTEIDLTTIDKTKANIKLTKYIGTDKDVVIPREIDEIPITYLNDDNSNSTIFALDYEKISTMNVVLQDNIKTIGKRAFYARYGDMVASFIRNVEIPKNVKEIGQFAFYGNQLTSVIIPNSVTIIEGGAFSYNQLTSVVIPDSVTTIEGNAFEGTQLTSVIIGNGIKYISWSAFSKDSSSNPNLESITMNKSCTDIKNIPASSTDTTKYYPWLSYSSPYTATGVTIYGSNNEVCDSF